MPEFLVDSLDALNGYGCWCYLDSGMMQGRNQPQDQMDSLCRTLTEGYECIIMTETEENERKPDYEPCDPTNTKYLAASIGADTNQIIHQCTIKNRNRGTCATRACIVDSQFVNNVFTLMIESGYKAIAHRLRHSQGFDPDLNCKTNLGSGSGNGNGNTASNGRRNLRKCCGTLPYSKPYKTNGGTRGCCTDPSGFEAITYNKLVLRCCQDGSVKAVCED